MLEAVAALKLEVVTMVMKKVLNQIDDVLMEQSKGCPKRLKNTFYMVFIHVAKQYPYRPPLPPPPLPLPPRCT